MNLEAQHDKDQGAYGSCQRGGRQAAGAAPNDVATCPHRGARGSSLGPMVASAQEPRWISLPKLPLASVASTPRRRPGD